MIIDKETARRVLREAAAAVARREEVDERWAERVSRLSQACEHTSKTPIAALGTQILAKAVDPTANPFSLKVKSGVRGAHSARSLAKDVLAAEALALDIDLGVTGREPLNNQPFFRYDEISRTMDVKGAAARGALNVLCDILDELDELTGVAEARRALRAFVAVRTRAARAPVELATAGPRSASELVALVAEFVSAASEGGKRAQAIAAGLMDAVFGPDRVVSGRVNDPDRRSPGDVSVTGSSGSDWERALEVRDKPVAAPDLLFVARKAQHADVGWAGVLAVAASQSDLDVREARDWASTRGVGLHVFVGWRPFVASLLEWAPVSEPRFCEAAFHACYDRLVDLEVSDAALAAWRSWRPS